MRRKSGGKSGAPCLIHQATFLELNYPFPPFGFIRAVPIVSSPVMDPFYTTLILAEGIAQEHHTHICREFCVFVSFTRWL